MKIEPRAGLEVFINQRNYITIMTVDGTHGEKEMVQIHPDDIEALIEGLKEEKADFVAQGFVAGETVSDEDFDARK
jgi:hypothetical protein